MERQLGRVDLVHWQGRRIAPEERAKSRVVRAIVMVALLSAVSLAVGFYSGLPIPVEVLQTVFVLVALGLAIAGARSAILALSSRRERSFY